MREIKFRGQIRYNSKKYKKGEWFYGNYRRSRSNNSFIEENYEEVEVIWNTVEQYTGLKDENGKEIYEGDIIEFSYDMFVGNFNTFIAKGKVVFEEGAFYVEVFENERPTVDEAYLLYSINLDTIKVIGNEFDNSELLTEKE